MKSHTRRRSRKGATVIVLTLGVAGASPVSGCLDRPLCASTSAASASELPEGFSGDCTPRTTNVFVDAITQSRVDKIDLLFMIDNSQSMGDKQEILREAVPDLVSRLVNPSCIDESGRPLAEDQQQALAIDDECPAGYERQFRPVRDIHVGIISSSLGTFNGGVCPQNGPEDEDKDDGGRLIGARPRAFSLGLADRPEGTPGFLSWLAPRGEAPPLSLDQFQQQFESLVDAVGEQGCGYEASLESWYRFLVDPAPPAQYQKVPCPSGGGECLEAVGIDEDLLAQRAAFLRPDSLVAVVMLSDENDCSMRGTGRFYYASQDRSLPRASAACAINPNDPCCYSCGQAAPEGCPVEPDCTPTSTLEGDNTALRCWDQKRRYGLDFLYPIERYVNALSQTSICAGRADLDPAACDGELVPNPLFSAGGIVRDPRFVFLAGIVGVPWQDLRADQDDQGLPYGDSEELHFFTAAQMRGDADDGVERDVWSIVLGKPNGAEPGGAPILPEDPLMRERIAPRSGTHPITEEALAPPNAGYLANKINGHERNVLRNDDLQYACIFPLREPFICPVGDPTCDCNGDVAASQNPLCQDETGAYSSTQTHAKAYPGTRFLQVLQGLQDTAIVASICPRNVTDEDRQDFGYRPAIEAVVDRLSSVLAGRCLPRALTVTEQKDGTMRVACNIVEAAPGSELGCDRPGRAPVEPDVVAPALERLRNQGRCGDGVGVACDLQSWTLCAVTPSLADTDGNGLLDCQEEGTSATDVGWCYIDPEKGLGSEEMVKMCAATERRMLKFVDPDDQTPARGAIILIACQGADLGVLP